MKIGAQLFTVRDYCTNLDDMADTLARVAEMGYTVVQVSGVCAYEPAWMQEQLKKNGLQCAITHTPPDRMMADPQAVIADHNVMDCRYIGIGGYPINDCGIKLFVKKFRPVAQQYVAAGKLLMYHNHDWEFSKLPGSTEVVLEELAQAMEPGEMGFTLDTYWAQNAGADPAAWLRRLAGRVSCVHLKDMDYGHKMAPLGLGNMNFSGILSACEDAGTQYLLVEQDDSNGRDPLDCLRISYDYLAARGLK